MNGARLAVLASTVAALAGVVGTVRVLLLMVPRLQAGNADGALLLWTVLPLALGALAIAAARGPSPAFLWTTVGAACGFVVIAGFSLGPFFIWEALALLVAGFFELDLVRPRWRLLAVPLWFATGALALMPLFFGIDRLVFRGEPAPAIVAGTWMCAAILSVRGAFACARASRPHAPRRRRALQASGVVALLTAAALFARAGLSALR